MCTERESTWSDPRTPAALSRRSFLTVSGAAGSDGTPIRRAQEAKCSNAAA